MAWLVDLAYLLVGAVTAPFWIVRMIQTGKIRTDWAGRFGRVPPLPAKRRQRLLLHAVSVGEVNAIRMLVDELAASATSPEIVVATTTDTGFARAQSLWNSRHAVVRFPLDFSFAIRRFLNAVQPDVAALVELEVWPNFTAICKRRTIPVLVVNGRLTERSLRRYRRVSALIRPSFRRLAHAAVQNKAYADRFEMLGISHDAITVAGTMKWDTAQIADDVAGSDQLAREMGIDPTRPLIVAGSTAPEEHRLILNAAPESCQLLCAPRKPEWFDQAAIDLPGCVRRSTQSATRDIATSTHQNRLFLLDTIGELRQAYALADIVVVGRSFGELHGSDMMEPVALGKPTIVGPAVADFQDTMDALLQGDGIVQTSAAELPEALCKLLSDPDRCAQLAANGREVIRKNQGATQRHAQLILQLLERRLRDQP